MLRKSISLGEGFQFDRIIQTLFITKLPKKDCSMSETKIQLRDNGPILVSGEFIVQDGEGNTLDLGGKTSIALCRCGQTANSPFCDGTHKGCGFMAANRAQPS